MRDLHVGFDAQIETRQRRGGISRYFGDLIRLLPQSGVHVTSARGDAKGLVGNRRWRHAEIIHATYYGGRPYRLRSSQRLVSSLFDMIPERHPEQFLLSQFRSPHANKIRWLSDSDLIISISAASADDLSFFAPTLDVDVRIIHLGSAIRCVEPWPVAALRHKDFWIMVGKRKTYKNGLTLLRALALVRNNIAGRTEMPTLVFVGGGPLSTLEYKYILTNRLADHILHISADDHHLAWLYQHALAVLVPSLAEGFSMPLIEGLLCDTPVIASDIEAHREVGHGYCQYVSPVNAKEWADILSQGANITMKRPSMMLGASRFNDRCKYYSTNRMIQQHKQCYEDLL